jgi:HPt (histidine-containing phosphotransfer) domain-containing protein
MIPVSHPYRLLCLEQPRVRQLTACTAGITMGDSNRSDSITFDWTPALSFVDGDKELLRDVAEAFLEECPGLMSAMGRAIEFSDGPALRRAAHVMSSAMRTFGLPGAGDAAARLEELAMANQFADAAPYFAELKHYVDKIVPAATELVQKSPDG